MKIFVTGSTGLVGTNLVKRLIELNHEVYALIRETSDISHIVDKKVHFIAGDVLDANTLDWKIEKIDVVIHCAARTTLAKAEKGAYKDFSDNIIGTRNIAEFALKRRVKHFIYISSCSVMNDYHDGEMDEDFPCGPDSEYGKSKYEGEKILNNYKVKYSFPITIFRPGLIYGPYDRGGMKQMIEFIDKGKFVVFGSGKNQKSLVSVHNLVDAIICALCNPKAIGEVFIVADGENYSLNYICEEIARLLNRKQKILHIPRILSLIIGVVADLANFVGLKVPVSSGDIRKFMTTHTYRIDKITRILGYKPKVSFREAIAEETEWYKNIK